MAKTIGSPVAGSLPSRRSHGRISRLVRPDAVCRMQIECSLQSQRVQVGEQSMGVGEEIPVPGVTGPSTRGVAGIGDVPVHVDDAYRQGQIMRSKVAHQVKQFVLAIGPVTAPPIAQRPAWKQGNGTAQAPIIAQACREIATVTKKIEIDTRLPLARSPSDHPARLPAAASSESSTTAQPLVDSRPGSSGIGPSVLSRVRAVPPRLPTSRSP
jgi:hypothetical protein